jgi:N-acetyl-gamma-glutamyl-phosphate/LysW-gamma-L-alpha-aminoadipyl-6-phosphate reductase
MEGSQSAMVNVSIIGGSGYAGGELVRLLLDHPGVKIQDVTSERVLVRGGAAAG